MSETRSSGQQLQLLAILPIERQGAWLDACLLCGHGRDLSITQVSTSTEAAAAVRHLKFDLLVFWHEGLIRDCLDGWEQLADLTDHEGFVALGMQTEEGWSERFIAAGAIACLDMDYTDPLTLVHSLRTAAELERLREEAFLYEQERQRKQQREAKEIDRALTSQRELLARLDQLGTGPLTVSDEEPSVAPQQKDAGDPLLGPIGERYLPTLQSFIFDESQHASIGVSQLAEHFCRLGTSSSAIMRVHLAAVTRLTAGRGAGSLRHCLSGADRFLMELLMRVVDRQSSLMTHLDIARGPSGSTMSLQAASDSMRLHSLPSPLAAA